MVKFIQKWFLGWLGVYINATKSNKHHFVNWFMRRFISTRFASKQDQTFTVIYERTLNSVKYWHGTGMMQYAKNMEIIPTFESMLRAGGLSPAHDIFDISQGEMLSVSCTDIRVYARIYADMHQFGGVNAKERCGPPFMWAYFYIVSAALIAISHMKLWWKVRERHRTAKVVKQNAKELWGRKVIKSAYLSLKDIFVNGSDIPGNFGILIGITSLKNITSTSPYISVYETRTSSLVPVDNWTHIEVPAKYKNEIISMLRSQKNPHLKNLPVYSIEKCEKYWCEKSFIHISVKASSSLL